MFRFDFGLASRRQGRRVSKRKRERRRFSHQRVLFCLFLSKGKGKESVETVEKEGERSELWSAIVEKEERMREGFLGCFPGGK